MPRTAKVYITDGSKLPSGVSALLNSNGVKYTEIDVSRDASMLGWIHGRTGHLEPPVVEFEGKFVQGEDVHVVAQRLGLRLSPREPEFRGACC
ncbi:MAG: glutaredoxin domain-containing protein [Vicinamibacterales bacterium]